MKASDLRIGNLVNYQEELLEVEWISYEQPFDPDYYYPIPLTEEWLIKFGFENNIIKANHNEIIYYSENNIGIRGMLGMIKPTKCEYIHQLQNLYFALTGEELIIKT